MEKKEIVKLGVNTVVAIGVGALAGSAIGMIPIAGGIVAKIVTKIGMIALESLIVSKTTSHVGDLIDSVDEGIKQVIEQKNEIVDNVTQIGFKCE